MFIQHWLRTPVAWRWVLLLACCATSVACDPYPTEDEPYLDVHSLSAPAKVEALNRLGESASPARRFATPESCQLQVEEKTGWWRWNAATFELSGTQILLRASVGEEQRYELVLVGADNAAAAVILNGNDRMDMQRAHLLVRLLQRSCVAAN